MPIWFLFLPSLIAIAFVGFIQVRDELSSQPEEISERHVDAEIPLIEGLAQL